MNGGMLGRLDVVFALVSRAIPFRRHAGMMRGLHEQFVGYRATGDGAAVTRVVAAYDGGNRHVRRLIGELEDHLAHDLVGACVHGSLATLEEIAYSDFDALVVLKDEVFESPRRLARVAGRLARARRHMYAHDPLQHHGWFVLCEADLRYYCTAYFPPILLAHAKALFPRDGAVFEINARPSGAESVAVFYGLARQVLQPIERGELPKTLYELKSVLSRFMLLPALYVAARWGEEIFKRESFGRARADFEGEVWTIMDEVSAIRAHWAVPDRWFGKSLMTRDMPLRRWLIRAVAPKIGYEIHRSLPASSYGRMAALVHAMVTQVDNAADTGDGVERPMLGSDEVAVR